MPVTNEENSLLGDHLPNRPYSGSAKGAAKVTFLNWLIAYFHLLSFPILPGTFDNPNRPRTFYIRKSPPRFPGRRFEGFSYLPKDSECHSLPQIPLLLDPEEQSWAFPFLVLSDKATLSFHYEFWAGIKTRHFSCLSCFPYQYSGNIRVMYCPPYQFKKQISTVIFRSKRGQFFSATIGVLALAMQRSLRFSIKGQLKTRWAPSHLRNARIKGGVRVLLDIKGFWLMGIETILETDFYEPVRKPDKESEKGT